MVKTGEVILDYLPELGGHSCQNLTVSAAKHTNLITVYTLILRLQQLLALPLSELIRYLKPQLWMT